MRFTPYSLTPLALLFIAGPLRADPLPGTKPLAAKGDLAAQIVAGIDKYLDRELAESAEKRQQFWKQDLSSYEAYSKSVQPNRERFRRLIGVVDARLPVTELEYLSGTAKQAHFAQGHGYKVYAVRWHVLDGVDAEGLLLEPNNKVLANVVAIPDADWTPEMLVGLAPGVPEKAQYARRLAENRCRVLVPTLIDRKDTWSGNQRFRMTNQPHREFVYRMAYEMGRHIIGYEVQKVLAAVDWFCREKTHPQVAVFGHGEGGLLAMYSAAADERIQSTFVSGYFGPREGVWSEPIYRNVWGLLREFGDAELVNLIAPRGIYVEVSEVPKVSGPPPARDGRSGAAPGKLASPPWNAVIAEFARKVTGIKGQGKRGQFSGPLITGEQAKPYPGQQVEDFLDFYLQTPDLSDGGKPPVDPRKNFDPALRQKRQFDQLVAYNQNLLRQSEYRRQESFWSKVDTSSLEKFEQSTKAHRDSFWEQVIGQLPKPSKPVNPQTRLSYDEPKWQGYEVVLDLYRDVFAYGILLVPKDLKPGETRPVVVCQHGLEGRPQDVVDPKKKTPYYNSFGAQLADMGYIVYAPQNPYIGGDKFRVLQRKANPLGLSLFSFIVRQHERTLDWLAKLPFVDAKKIAFYGLSYGGKTAMRVPAILPGYCLSICSGDFNEWIWKNVTLDFRGSYMLTGEYEMFEFNLGHTFNYAEMAALIAPRPFMVERGHDDGVGIDEQVAYEYAKVRRLYAKLKIPDRTAIEFFDGGHEIHGQGTFAFLRKHLGWPK